MKKWIFPILLLLLLTACGKQEAAGPVDQPYTLEIEYGENGVQAMTGGFEWVYRNGDSTASVMTDAADPLTMLSDIPFVNESKNLELELLFPVEPDRLEVAYRTNLDSYENPVAAEIPAFTLPAPGDGLNYLFEITATWEEAEKADCWGTCTYYFRFLPEGSTGDQTQELSLFRLLQLEAADLFGVEFINNLEEAQKTCRRGDDKQAVLDFLRANLSTSFEQIQVTDLDADYVLRLAVNDGSQLTLGYGTDGTDPWLLLGGVPYAAEAMDLESLWTGLDVDAVYLNPQTPGDYLQTSEDFPGEAWGEDFVYGYLRSIGDQVRFDEMAWIEDEAEPNGYRLEALEAGQDLPVSGDCQYWILENHATPYCQVTQEVLWQWAETTGWDVLFRMYRENGEIIAICEQYVP